MVCAAGQPKAPEGQACKWCVSRLQAPDTRTLPGQAAMSHLQLAPAGTGSRRALVGAFSLAALFSSLLASPGQPKKNEAACAATDRVRRFPAIPRQQLPRHPPLPPSRWHPAALKSCPISFLLVPTCPASVSRFRLHRAPQALPCRRQPLSRPAVTHNYRGRAGGRGPCRRGWLGRRQDRSACLVLLWPHRRRAPLKRPPCPVLGRMRPPAPSRAGGVPPSSIASSVSHTHTLHGPRCCRNMLTIPALGALLLCTLVVNTAAEVYASTSLAAAAANTLTGTVYDVDCPCECSPAPVPGLHLARPLSRVPLLLCLFPCCCACRRLGGCSTGWHQP